MARGGRVCIVNATRNTTLGDAITVADGSLSRMVGLLGKRKLDPGNGLWIVPSQGVHTLFMLFAIDVVFVSDDSTVVALRPAVPPYRMTSLIWKAHSVLELPADTIRQTQTAVG